MVAAAPVIAVAAKPVIASREQRKDDAQQRKEANEKKRPLKKEQDGIEKNMATLEAEKQNLHNKLASTLAPADIAEAGKRLKLVEDELEELLLELALSLSSFFRFVPEKSSTMIKNDSE
jgi:ATP-binding cassette subfamily F protein 3